MAYFTFGRTVEVFDSFEIKDALKAAGYRFDGLGKSWFKAVANPAELGAEISRLAGLGAMVEIPGNQDRQRTVARELMAAAKIESIKVFGLGEVKKEVA